MKLKDFSLVFVGLLINLLFGIVAFIVDKFFSATLGQNGFIHVGGTIALALGGGALLYTVAAKLSGIKSWEFYVLFFPIFLTGCLDTFASVEFWRVPHGGIFPNYAHTGDPILESVWAETMAYLDGTLMHFLNFINLYKFQHGSSWRSLLLFNVSAFVSMIVPFFLMLLTMRGVPTLLCQAFYGYIVYIFGGFICVLVQPKSFSFRGGSKRYNFFAQASTLDLAMLVLMILSVVIVLCRLLITIGLGAVGPLEIFEDTDPMLLFDGAIEDAMPAGVVHIWLTVGTTLPTTAVGFWYLLKGGKKPEYLWDLALIQTAFVYIGQGYSILGAFYWKTPAELQQSDGLDPLFWFINLVPLTSSALFLDYVSRDRVLGIAGGSKKNK